MPAEGGGGGRRKTRAVLHAVNPEQRAGPERDGGMSHTNLSRKDPLGFDASRDEVEAMISDRRPFCEIEDRIEGMSVSDEEKSALWLLAWSGQAEHVRHRTLAEALTLAAR